MVRWDGEWWFYGTTSITEILYFTLSTFPILPTLVRRERGEWLVEMFCNPNLLWYLSWLSDRRHYCKKRRTIRERQTGRLLLYLSSTLERGRQRDLLFSFPMTGKVKVSLFVLDWQNAQYFLQRLLNPTMWAKNMKK